MILPYQPETLGAARERFARAVSEVQPYAETGPGDNLIESRRHTFDARDGYRLCVSVDDGPEMGPKLHVSLWRVRPDGTERRLGLTADGARSFVDTWLRHVAGVRRPAVLGIGAGPQGTTELWRFDLFYPFAALPSAN